MKAKTIWVLVANATRAHVMEMQSPSSGLHALPDAIWAADPPAQYTDEAGITPSRAGAGRPSIERTDPADLAEVAFAKTVIGHLSLALKNKRFERLIIVAAPHLLGVLRPHMPAALAAVTTAQIDKDLTQSPPEQLRKSLEQVLPLGSRVR